MRKVRVPSFGINTKSYVYGDEIVALAKHADMLSEKYDIDVTFSAQLIDIPRIKAETKHLFLTAQYMDGITPGRGMGHVLPEALVAAGVYGVTLNHAEKPMTVAQLARAVKRAKEVGLAVTICADTVEECRMVATLKPDTIVAEETSRIATGVPSDMAYMKATEAAIKEMSPETKVVQGAGIKSYDDVYRAIKAGSCSAGGSSGICAAENPFEVMEEMIKAVARARDEMKAEGKI